MIWIQNAGILISNYTVAIISILYYDLSKDGNDEAVKISIERSVLKK